MNKQKSLLEGNNERSDGGGRCLAESRFNLSEPSPIGRSFVPADSISLYLPSLAASVSLCGAVLSISKVIGSAASD